MHLMVILFCLATASLAALPPGFEEEVYCPDGMCLRDRVPVPYRTGPRTMFLECFDLKTKKTSRPRAWGVQVDQSYKDTLLREKWHTDKCDELEILNSYYILGSRLDNVIGKVAWLSFI